MFPLAAGRQGRRKASSLGFAGRCFPFSQRTAGEKWAHPPGQWKREDKGCLIPSSSLLTHRMWRLLFCWPLGWVAIEQCVSKVTLLPCPFGTRNRYSNLSGGCSRHRPAAATLPPCPGAVAALGLEAWGKVLSWSRPSSCLPGSLGTSQQPFSVKGAAAGISGVPWAKARSGLLTHE